MDITLQEEIKKRLAALPQVVQDAIANIDAEKQLRAVSNNHKLHIDQWAILENEVMLTLLGFQDPVKLPANIEGEVGVTAEEAEALAKDISTIVFEPIREELERQLEHPDAKAEKVTDTEIAGQQALAAENTGVAPATPPPPKPTEKSIRAPISSAYTSQQTSTHRKSIVDDPYRVPPT
jgi:hypothetical protein